MIQVIQTIEGQDYSRVHPRAFEHDGCIIDIGCLTWNWSNLFIGKKRVIGVDPFEETIPEGAELFKGVVGPFNGISWMNFNTVASKIVESNALNIDSKLFNVLSWKDFCIKHNIDKISILKMNIEGSEYPLLHSMDIDDFEKVDQIVISFHNWMNPKWEYLTKASINLLTEVGFDLYQIDTEFNWILGLKK